MKDNYSATFSDSSFEEKSILERVPENVSHLASHPGENRTAADIGLRWNSSIQHTKIRNFQPPSYYEDYLMTASYSDKMQLHQEGQAIRLAESSQPSQSRSFLEIGCGDGSFLAHMRSRVDRVVGIEPSQRFGAEAIARGFEVITEYIGDGPCVTDEKFDLFASRQVFEHLPEPLSVLRGIRRMLNPGAVGFIEVPNGYRALRLKRFFEFFPDHVHYYSVNSLVSLASAAGMNVIECREAFGSDYLELWLRHDPRSDDFFEELDQNRQRVCKEVASFLRETAQAQQKTAIWGAGAKTLSICSAIPETELASLNCIVDADPHKHGRFLPGTAVEIVSPEDARLQDIEQVLILALSYEDEIRESIRTRIPHCKVIATLDRSGDLIRS